MSDTVLGIPMTVGSMFAVWGITAAVCMVGISIALSRVDRKAYVKSLHAKRYDRTLYVCTMCGLCNEDGTHQDAHCPVMQAEGNAIDNAWRMSRT